jgi:chromosome segregation ATPase
LAVFFNGVVDRAFTSKLTDTELKKIEEVANNESLRELKEEAEVKKQLEEKITFLEGKKQATEDEISEVVSQKHKINENIAELESDLAKEKEKSGFIDNLISNSERVKELKTKISQKEDKLTELNKKYSTLEDMLDETNEEIEEKQNTLVGKSNGVFDSLGNKLSELGESVTGAFDTNRLKQLKESMESSTSNMLNLIALFLFKTLFLPLLFLYLIIKGTNAIWNIEIRQKIKEAKDDLLGTVDNTADEKKSVS